MAPTWPNLGPTWAPRPSNLEPGSPKLEPRLRPKMLNDFGTQYLLQNRGLAVSFWIFLGSWGVRGTSWRILGALMSPFGGSWGPLGDLLGLFGVFGLGSLLRLSLSFLGCLLASLGASGKFLGRAFETSLDFSIFCRI